MPKGVADFTQTAEPRARERNPKTPGIGERRKVYERSLNNSSTLGVYGVGVGGSVADAMVRTETNASMWLEKFD